jgi:hypothetical protein
MRYAVCGTRYAVCGMRYAVCGMRYAVCGMWLILNIVLSILPGKGMTIFIVTQLICDKNDYLFSYFLSQDGIMGISGVYMQSKTPFEPRSGSINNR